MRSLLEPEHDRAEAAEPSRDLVLGMPALLGIFLGVALVCAVCFGFGYSSSHNFHLPERHLDAAPSARRAPLEPRPLGGSTPGGSGQEAESPETAYPTPAPDQAPEQAMEQSPEPSPDQAPNEVAQRRASPPSASLKPSPGAQHLVSDDLPAIPTRSVVPPPAREQAENLPAPSSRRLQASPVETAPDPESIPTPIGAGAMVQIAAVTRAADAQTLANALRHDGFDAIVRTATDDRFFHVQIGPFPSLQAAKTMRGKLADSGYNAFIKP